VALLITHVVLVRVVDREVLGLVAEQLRSLAGIPSVRSLSVREDLGLAPTTWDLCVLTQHRDADELAEFRLDEFHRSVGASLAVHVAASASVDLDSAGMEFLGG
jgi:hypothetical protein